MLNYQCGERIAEINNFKLDRDDNMTIDTKNKPKTLFLYDNEYNCCNKCSSSCDLDDDICCKSCSKVLYHLVPKKTIQPINNNYIKLNDTQKFQILPTNLIGTQSDAIVISGGAGLGKSYWIAQYLTEFKRLFKNKKIYLFSRKKEDKLLDDLIDKRIDCNLIVESELTADDFKGQLCIFDDCDTLSNTKKEPIRDLIYKLIEDICEVGRSLGITLIVSSHILCNGNESKRILNRANKVVFFKKGINKNVNYYLTDYVGYPKKEIEKIKRLDTRSICIVKSTHPHLIVGDREIFQIELN